LRPQHDTQHFNGSYFEKVNKFLTNIKNRAEKNDKTNEKNVYEFLGASMKNGFNETDELLKKCDTKDMEVPDKLEPLSDVRDIEDMPITIILSIPPDKSELVDDVLKNFDNDVSTAIILLCELYQNNKEKFNNENDTIKPPD